MPTTNTDQIRQLTNQVRLSGYLAELSDARTGVTQNGTPYMSFSGAIQCGEDAVNTVQFRTFVKSKKSDGSDSKNFVKVQEWYSNAVPMTKAPKENCTMVSALGSITDNPYVNNAGKLIEATQFNIVSFSDFNTQRGFEAIIDIEGYIMGVSEETRGEEATPTGRGKLRLMSRDIFSNILDIKNIIVPNSEDLNPEMLEEAGYTRGATATIYVSLLPNTPVARPRTGGIGKQREVTGRQYLEWVMTGATEIVDPDSEDAIQTGVAKKAMNVRKAMLQEIESNGYLGSGGSTSTTGNSSSSASRGTIGTKSVSASKSTATTKTPDKNGFIEVEEDEDFPF